MRSFIQDLTDAAGSELDTSPGNEQSADTVLEAPDDDDLTMTAQQDRAPQTSPARSHHPVAPSTENRETLPVVSPAAESLTNERSRDGRMRKMVSRQATQFFGGTSLFQMNVPAPTPAASVAAKSGATSFSPLQGTAHAAPGNLPESSDTQSSPFAPHNEVCRQLVSLFFANCYQSNHFIYREFFLRDYAKCSGPYYSDMLLSAICALGALVSEDGHLHSTYLSFSSYAESQALASLVSPDLTTLQTLMILGPLEVGQGRASKGWLFCGMAFRLAHEMGLHLDPSNWELGQATSSVDREILRRVYWAVFVADKQMSLYFGRPPALYPQEADVRNTIRIPYPPEWEHLLDTYIARGTSVNAFEDGIAVVGSFVHRVELAKIFHTMIVTVFENRERQASQTCGIAEAAHHVHTLLERWLSQLPQKLQWNPWKIEKVPHYILHLHMAFHTGMIILHRPPDRCSDEDLSSQSEEVDICYQSLAAILRLLNSYQRHYSLRTLPLEIVHTLAAAARIILLKKRLEESSWSAISVRKPLDQILDVMDAISTVWPCVLEIKSGIESMRGSSPEFHGRPPNAEQDYLSFLDNGGNSLSTPWQSSMAQTDSDLGFLVTEESLNDFAGWSGLMEGAS